LERLRFSWVLPNQLAGCAGPTGDDDLLFLKSKGISVLVRLAEKSKAQITSEQVARAGMTDFHEPVPDFGAPSQKQIDRIVKYVKEKLNDGAKVAVSCGAGIGRTNAILSCILISLGYTVEDALNLIKKRRGTSPEVKEQLDAISKFAQSIGKR
jgi:atypical dual specificity phosphatase